MLIRSQNKLVVFDLTKVVMYIPPAERKIYIRSDLNVSIAPTLVATYSTHEKALEQLDKIWSGVAMGYNMFKFEEDK